MKKEEKTADVSRLLSEYGASVPEKGWVPAPRYLLRRYRILRNLDPLPRGRVLEIGCGAGALLNDLSMMGFDCTAIETSSIALSLATFLNRRNQRVVVHGKMQAGWKNAFDYVLAFDVLEHIKEDRKALDQWVGFLKPGGRLSISVPAHKKRWSAHDFVAGHYRRYERDELQALISRCGLTIERFENYGFPLGNMIAPFRFHFYTKSSRRNATPFHLEDQLKRNTERSGVERAVETKLYPLQKIWIAKVAMNLFCRLQGLFLKADWGTGYLVVAKL